MKENPHLLTLVKYILPEEIFEYFEITRIEEQGKELHIYLDENPDKPNCYCAYACCRTIASCGNNVNQHNIQ